MNLYPDTSFLCSIYRQQSRTPEALAFRARLKEPLPFTSLLEFEFVQALRLQVFLHEADNKKGFGQQEADRTLALWQGDIAAGLLYKVAYDAEAVTQLALGYSNLYTVENGHRTLDLLHVATAVHLRVATFLTFDVRQTILAKAAGLKVPF
jgi:predicted nucleic acid-binding protein